MTRPAVCHPDRPHHGRGLCKTCHQRAWRAGTLSLTPPSRTRPPERCDHEPKASRGLCGSCYGKHRWAGTLDRFPLARPQRRRVDFVADYRLLRSEGYTPPQIADRLGMKYRTLRSAVARAVRAGDLTPDRRTA